MVDIGVYNSCCHFCKYCYANYDENLAKKISKSHKNIFSFNRKVR